MNRVVGILIVVLICVGGFGMRAAGASVALPVTGGALGRAVILFGVSPGDQNDWSETGGYVTGGQLGKGNFDFENNAFPSSCPSSGTGRLVRSDGAVLSGAITRTGTCSGAPGTEQIIFTATTGTRDLLGARLVFTVQPGVAYPLPGDGVDFGVASQIQGTVTTTSRIGYAMSDANARVFAFGGAPSLGDAPTTSVTRIAFTPSRNGYWIVNAAGQVYAFGDAHWYGNAPRLGSGETVRSIAPTTTNHGYLLFTSAGRVLAFGDASFYGDMHTTRLSGAIVDATTTADGHGYYLLGSDGGVFCFGNAHFFGSTGNLRLNQPIDGIATTMTGHGYWLVASDGGVFSFGDAHFRGSMGGQHLHQPIIGIARYGTGYLMAARDGGIFNFSNQLFFGSLGGTTSPTPIAAIASTG
jgi:hypothetical protein